MGLDAALLFPPPSAPCSSLFSFSCFFGFFLFILIFFPSKRPHPRNNLMYRVACSVSFFPAKFSRRVQGYRTLGTFRICGRFGTATFLASSAKSSIVRSQLHSERFLSRLIIAGCRTFIIRNSLRNLIVFRAIFYPPVLYSTFFLLIFKKFLFFTQIYPCPSRDDVMYRVGCSVWLFSLSTRTQMHDCSYFRNSLPSRPSSKLFLP